MKARVIAVGVALLVGFGVARPQVDGSSEVVRLHGATMSEPMRETIQMYGKTQKIVGGKEAPDGAFPWQVSLGIAGIHDAYAAHFCGGTIYSTRWIITAAHCVDTADPADVAVAAGSNELNHATKRTGVQRILIRAGFNRATKNHDIALLELSEPLVMGDKVKSIPLLLPQDEGKVLIKDERLVAVGWGATESGGGPVRSLRFVEVPFVDRSTCNRPLAYDGNVTENMLCAGLAAGSKDPCKGDSGGPLTAKTSSSPLLAGITSGGDGCARPNKVGIYTRVPRYVGWIENCVNNPDRCN